MELINSYTRSEAIDEGVLIDVTEDAKQVGIPYPTAMTCSAWNIHVHVPKGIVPDEERARLLDILWMLGWAIAHQGEGRNELHYGFMRRTAYGPEMVHLKALCGPGDCLEPVITIMLTDEE